MTDQEASTTEIPAVVEAQSLKLPELRLWCVQRDAVRPGDGDTSEVPWADADDVLSAFTGREIEMHLARSTGNCRLSSQLRSSGSRKAQIGSHRFLQRSHHNGRGRLGTRPSPLWIRGALPRPVINVLPAATKVVELPPSRLSASVSPSC